MEGSNDSKILSITVPETAVLRRVTKEEALKGMPK